MKEFKRSFYEHRTGFNGFYHIISLGTNNEEFKQFLTLHSNDQDIIFDTVSFYVKNITVIQKISIERQHQNKKHGSNLLKEILNNQKGAAIVSCDMLQNQRFGFLLEQFYENHDFKTIAIYQDFPLMIYPESLALKVIEALNNI